MFCRCAQSQHIRFRPAQSPSQSLSFTKVPDKHQRACDATTNGSQGEADCQAYGKGDILKPDDANIDIYGFLVAVRKHDSNQHKDNDDDGDGKFAQYG